MRILLINPPQTCYRGSLPMQAHFPLGLMYIAAVLDKAGYEVQVLDALLTDSPPKKTKDAKQYGMRWEEIRAQIEKRKPDIVGITNPFSSQVANAIQVARVVKEANPKTLTIVGGPHATVRPSDFLKEAEGIDIVVMGEGEYTMLDIVQHQADGTGVGEIEGIACRKDGEVKINPRRAFITNLDELPFPGYHLVDMERYLAPSRYNVTRFKREVQMITSRGCPFNCVFCSIHPHMGRKYRVHSPKYVLSHIEHLVNTYRVEHVHFEDDNLTLNRARFTEILNGLLTSGLKFIWDAPNGVRADTLTDDLLRHMKQAGCKRLNISVESGVQRILDDIVGKRLRLGNVIRAVEGCKQNGIEVDAFYTIGYPGETKEEMKRTTDFALMLKRKYGVNMVLLVVTPLYGTRLYDICESNGYFAQEVTPRSISTALQFHGKGLIQPEDFTAEEVNKLAWRAYQVHTRLSLLDFIKDWRTKVRQLVREPKVAFRYLKLLLGF